MENVGLTYSTNWVDEIPFFLERKLRSSKSLYELKLRKYTSNDGMKIKQTKRKERKETPQLIGLLLGEKKSGIGDL